jgi:hypothetical protein
LGGCATQTLGGPGNAASLRGLRGVLPGVRGSDLVDDRHELLPRKRSTCSRVSQTSKMRNPRPVKPAVSSRNPSMGSRVARTRSTTAVARWTAARRRRLEQIDAPGLARRSPRHSSALGRRFRRGYADIDVVEVVVTLVGFQVIWVCRPRRSITYRPPSRAFGGTAAAGPSVGRNTASPLASP